MNVLERFELFRARAEELRNSRFLSKGSITPLSLSWNHVKGFEKFGPGVDEEELKSFLLTFRQFVLQGEPVFLFSIYNACQKYFTSDTLKGFLKQSRDDYSHALQQAGFNVVVDGQTLTPEKVMDWWINGHYFHSDQDKARQLMRLESMGMVLSKAVFINFLGIAVSHVLYTATVITAALREGHVDRARAIQDTS